MKTSLNIPKVGARMTRVVTPTFDQSNIHDSLDHNQFSKASVSVIEYALLAALLLVLIVGVIATTSVQIGSQILALLA
jgi:hypothetical protein